MTNTESFSPVDYCKQYLIECKKCHFKVYAMYNELFETKSDCTILRKDRINQILKHECGKDLDASNRAAKRKKRLEDSGFLPLSDEEKRKALNNLIRKA